MIYLDSCIVIYLVEEHPVYAPIILSRLEGVTADIGYSPLVEMECLVLPIRQQRTELIRRFQGFFACCRRLQMNDEVFHLATKTRATHAIKTPDALHFATARYYGCDALWTNDDRLGQAASGLAVNLLKE